MSQPITSPESSKVLRASIWVAIGALVAAAIVCVVWVLTGDTNGMIGKAFLTILLLAAFAGVSIFEANVAARRPAWLSLASIITWVVILLIGAFLIWMPAGENSYGWADRFFRYVLIILVLQGALLHIRLYYPAHLRLDKTFTTITTYVTVGLISILAIMLVLPLVLFEQLEFKSLYWRVVVALAILAAVGTALVPLVNALFAPRKPRAAAQPQAYAPMPQAPAAPAAAWPTYADAVTPLPVLADGSPDWNAYYTGHATADVAPAQEAAPETAEAAPAPDQYPPAPPLPPQQG